jgi:hypothetical protein
VIEPGGTSSDLKAAATELRTPREIVLTLRLSGYDLDRVGTLWGDSMRVALAHRASCAI